VRIDAAILFILILLGVPIASAIVPGDTRQSWPIITSPELNVTGIAIANHTIPSGYGLPPAIIHIEVTISETLLPALKGEMAAGPRTIGLSAGPVSLAILIVTIIAGAAGVWYLVRRKPEETEDEEESGE
jgi:hypothetical protein